jgi:uncharacterized membrane-anchored protein YjiN (DUF445 family)
MHKRFTPVLLIFVALSVGLAACGESKSDKAKKQVCSARSDIQKQVNTLKGLTLSTATASQVKDSLSAIQDDVKKIADAQGQLNSDRKQQVQSANSQFKSQVSSIVSNVGTNLSLSNAKSQLTSALQQLATSYQQTLAKVDCS